MPQQAEPLAFSLGEHGGLGMDAGVDAQHDLAPSRDVAVNVAISRRWRGSHQRLRESGLQFLDRIAVKNPHRPTVLMGATQCMFDKIPLFTLIPKISKYAA